MITSCFSADARGGERSLAMKAKDIMTRDVVTVVPQSSVHEVAALLVKHRISGIPVTAPDGRLLGLVSEGDLVERAEVDADPKGKWWLEGFSDTEALANRYARAHGTTAAAVMTRRIATVGPDADLADVAHILQAHHIKRVPVVQDGKLLGIITRSDIVRAVSDAARPADSTKRTDGDLQRAILERLREERWLDASYINLIVDKGRVTVAGLIGSNEERRALCSLVEEVAGPGSVIDQLKVGLPVVTEF
jgi:CBS-domain-containing membrane protein